MVSLGAETGLEQLTECFRRFPSRPLVRQQVFLVDVVLFYQMGRDMTDTNKMSESIAEKTAKLHRLLGDNEKDRWETGVETASRWGEFYLHGKDSDG